MKVTRLGKRRTSGEKSPKNNGGILYFDVFNSLMEINATQDNKKGNRQTSKERKNG